MPTLQEFKDAFDSKYDDVRLNAANYLFEMHKKDYPFSEDLMDFVISKLNDSSELVRTRVAQFLYLRVNSGHNLGKSWFKLLRFLRSNDAVIRKSVISIFGKLNSSEAEFKRVLNDPRLTSEQRFEISEALGHYYSNAKYLSSLNDNLKSDKLEIVKGALNAIRIQQSLGVLAPKDITNLKPSIQSAYSEITKPKIVDRKTPKRIPIELRDRYKHARA